MRRRWRKVLNWFGGPARAAALIGMSALIALVAAPALVGGALSRAGPDPRRVSVPAFAVIGPAGRRIGTLKVDYPASMRENESRPVVVSYEAAGRWREHFAAHPGRRLEVSLSGARLDIVPEPARHVFRNDLIARRGVDRRSWQIVPRAAGDYSLHLRLEATPAAAFSPRPVSANGELRPAGEDQSLPVTVHTLYGVSETTVALAKIAVGLLSFLVSLAGLPLLVRLLRGLAGLAPVQSPAPARARAAPAPEAPPPRRPRPRSRGRTKRD